MQVVYPDTGNLDIRPVFESTSALKNSYSYVQLFHKKPPCKSWERRQSVNPQAPASSGVVLFCRWELELLRKPSVCDFETGGPIRT